MQIQAINNNTHTLDFPKIARGKDVCFGAIKIQDGLLNNKNRKAVYDYITGKLNEIDLSDRLRRSFVERTENYGYDILFSKGVKKNSVRVDVVDILTQQKADVWNGTSISDYTLVGTYTKGEQFDINHFNNVYKPQEKDTKKFGFIMKSFIGTFIAASVCGIGLIIKKDIDRVFKPKSKQTEVLLKDANMTDSIKPILEDSFKLGKKVIKK